MTTMEAVSPAALATYPREVLAAWYCEMNCFNWPDDFPVLKPDGWDGLTDQQRRELPMARNAFLALKVAVPRKERLRAWHKGGYAGDPKTDQEFEAWWEITGRFPLFDES